MDGGKPVNGYTLVQLAKPVGFPGTEEEWREGLRMLSFCDSATRKEFRIFINKMCDVYGIPLEMILSSIGTEITMLQNIASQAKKGVVL